MLEWRIALSGVVVNRNSVETSDDMSSCEREGNIWTRLSGNMENGPSPNNSNQRNFGGNETEMADWKMSPIDVIDFAAELTGPTERGEKEEDNKPIVDGNNNNIYDDE